MLRTKDVASVTEELYFKLHLTSITCNLNQNSHKWLVTIVLDRLAAFTELLAFRIDFFLPDWVALTVHSFDHHFFMKF